MKEKDRSWGQDRWFQNTFYFAPRTLGRWSNLTIFFFKWVETNQLEEVKGIFIQIAVVIDAFAHRKQWSFRSMIQYAGIHWSFLAKYFSFFQNPCYIFLKQKPTYVSKSTCRKGCWGIHYQTLESFEKKTGSSPARLVAAMAAANEVARVMAEAAALVQETWKDMAGGLGAPKRRNCRTMSDPLFRGTIFL